MLCALALTPLVSSHPQCLDLMPPFTPGSRTTGFCSVYFGCCTTSQNTAVKKKYRAAVRSLDRPTRRRCKGFAKEILCASCSPFAAHIFRAEPPSTARTFPGLCTTYCETLYSDCFELISLLTDDPNILATINSQQTFCDAVALPTAEDMYCLPDWRKVPSLGEQIHPSRVNAKGCLCVEEFSSGLASPLIVVNANDGSERVFIGEQQGLVHISLEDKSKLATPFLDIRSSVMNNDGSSRDERGFLGMTFHPQHKQNGLFYVYYSANNAGHVSRISEIRTMTGDPNQADPSTERVILEIPEPFGNHNGGQILFGDDGFLYLCVGDGGSGGDPRRNGQNLNSLLGTILRIDVDQTSVGLQYAIPSDNPFIGQNARPEIFAYGMRNPWRCGKDSGDALSGAGRGRIICGDVGQSAREELDLIESGGNYGWNIKEGFICFSTPCVVPGNEVLPILDYGRSLGGSITGGEFYRGWRNPNYYGEYIYGDFVSGNIWSLKENGAGVWENDEVTMCGTDLCRDGLTSNYLNNILSYGRDESGEVYMCTTDGSTPSARRGKVFRFVDPARRGHPDQQKCLHRGCEFKIGESFPSTDGCNTCRCEHGLVVCTDTPCPNAVKKHCYVDGQWYTKGERYFTWEYGRCMQCSCRSRCRQKNCSVVRDSDC